MKTEPILITLEYLNSHKTEKGGYNKKQIESLGLTWPLVSGWKDELIGQILSAEKALAFEQAKYKTKPSKSKMNTEMAISYLVKNANRLTHQQIVRIRTIEKTFFECINKVNKK